MSELIHIIRVGRYSRIDIFFKNITKKDTSLFINEKIIINSRYLCVCVCMNGRQYRRNDCIYRVNVWI